MIIKSVKKVKRMIILWYIKNPDGVSGLGYANNVEQGGCEEDLCVLESR